MAVPAGMGAFPFADLDTVAGNGLFGNGGDCGSDLKIVSPLRSFELQLVSIICSTMFEI